MALGEFVILALVAAHAFVVGIMAYVVWMDDSDR